MDKELLAKKLYGQRVNALVKDSQVESDMIDELWESKTSPNDAAKLIEESRIEYQIMKDLGDIHVPFIEFLMPRVNILQVNITDWENVNNYFEFK